MNFMGILSGKKNTPPPRKIERMRCIYAFSFSESPLILLQLALKQLLILDASVTTRACRVRISCVMWLKPS